jgi:methyl-accepting chemotaxis protein
MLLIAILAVAGIISIIEFKWLSNSVHGLIQDNYKSIEASKTMIGAVEREDSGILLLMLGEWETGKMIIDSADIIFLAALETAKNNITEPGEERYIENIESTYSTFKEKWGRPIADIYKDGDISWYNNDIHQSFLNTRNAIERLMTLNQTALYNEASELKEKSKRAIMPGIVSIISALILSALLNFFITRYFVRPISELAEAVNDYQIGQNKLRSDIRSDDEIKKLETAINDLIHRSAKLTQPPMQ